MSSNAAPASTVRIHVNIEIDTAALQAVVQNAKRLVGRDAKGHYRVDTADKVGEMISRFLAEKDFTAYAEDTTHYNPEVSD